MKTLLLIAACLALPLAARADGGVVLEHRQVDGLNVTIFASPVPLRAGPADISVMVQKVGDTSPILDAKVDLAWSAEPGAFPVWMPPCCSMKTADRLPATLGQSQNKMLYSAMMPLRQAGPSKLLVRVVRDGVVVAIPCEITVAPPQPPLVAYWSFLAFPPILIAGFAVHQSLVRRPSKPLRDS